MSMPRLFAGPASPAASAEGAWASLITWNILADGEKLALSSKHDYCPLELRAWPGRVKRVVSELLSYDSDLVCLQECSAAAFERDLQPRLGQGLPANALGQPASDFGMVGFHYSVWLPEEAQRNHARASSTGLAVFVRVAAWEPVAARAVLFSSLVEDGRHTGKLREKLRSQSDAAFMLLVRSRETGQRLLVVCTHLFWDPHFPHVKACQAELLCTAVSTYLSELDEPGAPPPALVIAGDFNSVPHLQPRFLPEAQRGALPETPPDAWARSAAYGLLVSGAVAPDHPEHPDAFGKAPADPAQPASKKPKRAAPQVGPLLHELNLRDAYAGAIAPGPLPLSTHADDFAGNLDYVWIGGDAVVRRVLTMPYDVARPDEFGKIPDAKWPSDHLALGVAMQIVAAPAAPAAAEVAPAAEEAATSEAAAEAPAAEEAATSEAEAALEATTSEAEAATCVECVGADPSSWTVTD